MATKRQIENHSVTTYARYLEQQGYTSDRAIAASLDMLRRGTLPIVQPPDVSTEQIQQMKTMGKNRRDVLRRARRQRINQILRLKKKMKG